jgi:hypothetical protein
VPQHRGGAEAVLEAARKASVSAISGSSTSTCRHLPARRRRVRNRSRSCPNRSPRRAGRGRTGARTASTSRAATSAWSARARGREIGAGAGIGAVAIDRRPAPARPAPAMPRSTPSIRPRFPPARGSSPVRLRAPRSPPALRGHAFGRPPGQAVFGHGGRAAQRPAARQHHPRDRGERRRSNSPRSIRSAAAAVAAAAPAALEQRAQRSGTDLSPAGVPDPRRSRRSARPQRRDHDAARRRTSIPSGTR